MSTSSRKSFILYNDLIHTVKKMPQKDVSNLFLRILSYANNEELENDGLIVDLVFQPIKQQLDRDMGKWDKVREARSKAGKKGGTKSGEKRREKNEANEANEAIASNPISDSKAIDLKPNLNNQKNEANEANEATRRSNSSSNSSSNSNSNNTKLLKEEFLKFWKNYTPIRTTEGKYVQKGSKGDAEKEYNLLIKSGTLHEEIIKGLEIYLRQCKSGNTLTLHPVRFLKRKIFSIEEEQVVDADKPMNERERKEAIIREEMREEEAGLLERDLVIYNNRGIDAF